VKVSVYQRIARRANWLRLRADQLYGLEFPGLQIIYLPLDSNIAGYWQDGVPVIFLNERFIKERPAWCARDLITHEFSHIVTYHLERHAPDHGTLFKQVCRNFGVVPYIFHDVRLKGKR
jgi:hypothetical protein